MTNTAIIETEDASIGMTGLFDVAGKTVLVTGGAHGIGLMLARGFVDAGAFVIISSRDADACVAAGAQLSSIGTCVPHPADLATTEGIRSVAECAAEFAPRLDVLVNHLDATTRNAIQNRGPASAFDHVLDINLWPAISLTQQVLPQLRAAATVHDPARVINVGSFHWPVNFDGVFPYGGGRAALHILLRKLAPALADERVTVNAIAAGGFPSMLAESEFADAEQPEPSEIAVPLGRLGDADDIVGAAIFLASRASAYLTGAVVPVDGGLTSAR